MTQPPLRPPQFLLSRSKAAPTSSSTSLDALATTTTPTPTPTPQISRASSRTRPVPSLQTPHSAQTDVSDRATAALIRRVLVPHTHGATDAKPIDELLPSLTSSNDVDLQLYAIIAIIIKEFVFSWYGKITPDQGFVEEVIRIIAHCTRALEQRFRAVDLESLLLDEIPEFIESHVKAFRASHQSLHPPPIARNARVVYHTLIPHPALSPVPDDTISSALEEQLKNEAAYRQLLVQGVLAVLLPTEDLGNSCLRTLVADIIGEMILGNGIGGKASEGWLIWDGLTKVVLTVKARIQHKGLASGEEKEEVGTRSRLEKFGLLSSEQPVQQEKDPMSSAASVKNRQWSFGLTEIFWRVLQYGYLAFVAMRFIFEGLYATSSQTPRSLSLPVASNVMTRPVGDGQAGEHGGRKPMVTFKMVGLVGLLLDLSDRMPWLSGCGALLQYHLVGGVSRVAALDGVLDRFLRHIISTHVLTPSLLPPLLHTIRTSLFPGNALAPPRPIPSAAQQLAIKRSCAETILDVIPQVVARRLLLGSSLRSLRQQREEKLADDNSPHAERSATPAAAGKSNEREMMLQEIEAVLDVFGDSYCNKHLLYGIIELCLVRIVPEISEMGVRELIEGRLGEG
ncbi:MAG: hypothetical protein MMC33_007265 [Icmadophila ericetorum]|nr:hypothetical protein [Icmadophila ericetorum]